MTTKQDISLLKKLRRVLIGESRDIQDKNIFHKLSLIAFFAWVGLGADGLSSSCYGPEEAFRALHGHPFLAIFVGIASAITVFIISASYNQIIELFPSGGGGYLVASRLLSPKAGMISGTSLLIDYILTITISIASGADALFSFLPAGLHSTKLIVGVVGIIGLTILNLRGVKESVSVMLPIFMVFVLTHAFVILYAIFQHAMDFPVLVDRTTTDLNSTVSQLGLGGTILLLLRAYTMGAGTYTGIEAVSNGTPILRDPKVKTAKQTMRYMAISLAVTVLGLMIAYALFDVHPSSTKTLNAVLLDSLTANWGGTPAYVFILVTLLSEAFLLLIAAQAGFLDGPRILANMAVDRWLPTKFASLSDRLVTQNGILLMGITAGIMMVASGGSVHFLVVLYSINVFITFSLSQLGMVRHWLQVRDTEKKWKGKILINGIGLFLTTSILISVIIMKFSEGGWVTLLITAVAIIPLFAIRRHYDHTYKLIKNLDATIMPAIEKKEIIPVSTITEPVIDRHGKTAVILVNGFSGLGIHTLASIMKTFTGVFSNFVFVQVGIIDAANFKSTEELDLVKNNIDVGVNKYVEFMQGNGYPSRGYSRIGTDVVEEVEKIAPEIMHDFPHVVFFGGQIVMPKESFFTRLLHNYTVFAVQRKLYGNGIPVMIVPVLLKDTVAV